MFSTLITLLMCTKSLLYYTLLASFYIGKTLFELISSAALKASGLCTYLLAAIEILLEDFGVFLRDLSEHAGFGLRLVYKTFEYALGIFTFVYNPFASSLQLFFTTLTTFFTWLTNFYNHTTAFISFILLNAKKLLVLFGSGIWFVLTIIPVAIVSSGLLLLYYVEVLFEEVNILSSTIWRGLLESIKNVIEFFWDVPLESLMGLAILACLIYICKMYFSLIRNNVMRCVGGMKNLFVMKVSLPKKFLELREPVKTATTATKAEDQSICVVCQTKPKNMLILPCKHLCTCEDCMNQIRRYSGKCPLCRTQMDRSILVYT